MKHFCLFILFISLLSPAAAQVITTFAGKGSFGFSGEGGLAVDAEFNFLVGIGSDRFGNIYIADRVNSVVQKIDAHGILTRFAGNGVVGESGDGGPATAASLQLGLAVGLVADSTGNIYFAAKGKVRKVNTAGVITTVAGIGSYGSSGDGGPATAAELRTATGLCFDEGGNLYIADQQSSNVRKINTTGTISTVAGTTFGSSGDGGYATRAQLKSPMGISFDANNNLYIADFDDWKVRQVKANGVITSYAGGAGSTGYTVCHGCSASSMILDGPIGLVTDKDGIVYVSAIVDAAIHKLTTNNKTFTVAGTGIEGFSGDGGLATEAKLHSPTMICLDRDGNLLIADKANARIRKVWLGTAYTPTVNLGSSLLYVYPNPTVSKAFTCNAITADTSESAGLVITDVVGRVVTTMSCTTNTPIPVSLPVPAGMYFITATTRSGKRMSAKIIVD